MRFIILSLLLTVSVSMPAAENKKGRGLAQEQNMEIVAGDFICKVTTGIQVLHGREFKVDVLTVLDSQKDKICSYTANLGNAERFFAVVPLEFPSEPNRYLLTTWELPRVNEFKILDTSKPGPVCTFFERTFTAQTLNYGAPEKDNPSKASLDIERLDPVDGTTIETSKRTSCYPDETKGLVCTDYKFKASQPDNP